MGILWFEEGSDGVVIPPAPPPSIVELVESLSDAEKMFIQESPPGLWPENQDSNFGMLRKVITGFIQDEADLVNELFVELFIETAHGYLARWEKEYGLPVSPPVYDEMFRRLLLLFRARKQPFTRTARAQIIETVIRGAHTFSLELVYDGIPFTVEGLLFIDEDGGLPDFIYGTQIPPEGLVLDGSGITMEASYYVTENIPAYSYHVGIRNDFAPDIDLMTRELAHITPAGISFDVAIEP
jgi:hypothetical protein